MREHRRTHGAGGNCFDLAVWLLYDLREAGFEAAPIGYELEQPDAHVAILALDRDGREYYCDLGDCWRQPLATDSTGWCDKEGPGYEVRMQRTSNLLAVRCRRRDGKTWTDEFALPPVSDQELLRACNHSQSLLRRAFCELLRPYPGHDGVFLWEYDEGRTFYHLPNGREYEPDTPEIARRIHEATGLSVEVIEAGLQAYVDQ